MNIRNSASIALWIAVVFSTNVIASDIAIYRWVDENNVVHFSQHQPKDGNYSQLTTVASYKARAKELPKDTSTPSVDEQLSAFEKEKEEVIAKNKEIADKNCQAAKLNEKTLNSFETVMITDAEGKNKALSDKEKNAQLELSKKHISMYCDNKS
jgi:hypothetical protein